MSVISFLTSDLNDVAVVLGVFLIEFFDFTSISSSEKPKTKKDKQVCIALITSTILLINYFSLITMS